MQASDSAEEPPGSRPRSKREIGLWMAIALAVGNMVGSGIFLLPAPRISCPIERDALPAS